MHFIKNIFDQDDIILWVYNSTNKEFYVSKSFYNETGYEYSCIMNINDFNEILSVTDKKLFSLQLENLEKLQMQSFEIRLRIICVSGNTKEYLVKGSKIDNKKLCEEDSNTSLIMGSIYCLDEKKKRDSKLKELSYYDSLTQLPYGPLFLFKASAVVKGQGINQQLAMICINIDNFKSIKSIYGYSVSNELLKEISYILRRCISQKDIIGRLSHEEFILLLQDIKNIGELDYRISRIIKELKEPINIRNMEIGITCSAGVGMHPSDADSAEELVSCAQIAMFSAKEKGRYCYHFYSKIQKEDLYTRLKLEKSLRRTQNGKEFYIVYQPQLDLQTNIIRGAEALLRWDSAEYGEIMPDIFIPLAEESGLIINIGFWVLKEVCKQIKKWGEEGLFIPVSVNISSIQLKNKNFCKKVFDIIDSAGIPYEMIQMEITESALLDDFENVSHVLNKLRSKNIKIALDDFGKGYSSLNYIKQLPLDTIKIDRHFIKNLEEDQKEKIIANTIITLAHLLGMEVVAEGVETTSQYEYLKKSRCNIVQGFYISQPLKVDKYIDFISRKKYCNNY
jgi:diguanylate cyclase (GGDEF)-like protein